jgi:DNA replicative helicase MCM subunit Mcm2 (Cdc46/Mcm family)
MVLRYPDVLLDLASQALVEAQKRLLSCDQMRASVDEGRSSVKLDVSMRFTHLPAISEFCKPNISCIRAGDVGGLVQVAFLIRTSSQAPPHFAKMCSMQVSGTVIRTGAVKMLEHAKSFVCSKCGHAFTVSADMEQGNILEEPAACPMIGDATKPCKSTKFNLEGAKCEHCRN